MLGRYIVKLPNFKRSDRLAYTRTTLIHTYIVHHLHDFG